jgi:acetylornithine/N-succinyldiaminopimelate aminotransferase
VLHAILIEIFTDEGIGTMVTTGGGAAPVSPSKPRSPREGATMTTLHPDTVAAAAVSRWQARDAAHVLPTYGRRPLAFVSGSGTALFDAAGRPYLDFLTGLAVTSLGHAHGAVTAAVAHQVSTLVHTSNLFLTEPMLELAEKLARITGWDDARTFFAQCGATANEAAIKLARRHGKRQHPDKVRIVTLEGSFHGRTLATLEATGQPAKHEPFAPLAGFVDTVPHDDPDALRRSGHR